MLSRLKSRLASLQGRDRHLHELLTGSVVAVFVKVLAAVAALLMNVVVARALGASESGLFFLAFTLVTILASVARIGLDNTVVRFIAAEQVAGNAGNIRAIGRIAMRWVFWSSIVCGLLVWLISPLVAQWLFPQPGFAPVLAMMALVIPLMAIHTLYAQMLQGLKRIAQSLLTYNAIAPLLLVLIVMLQPVDSAWSTAGLFAVCSLLTVLIGVWWWDRAAPRVAATEDFDSRKLLDSCMPLWGVMVLTLLIQWSSQLLLGAWSSAAEVALFTVALRVSQLTTFLLIAINSIAAPKFAALHRQGDHEGLRRVALLSVRIMLITVVPLVAFILLFPEWLMGMFGSEFVGAADALRILVVGQFINVATGSVGFLLSMSGHERLLTRNTLVGALLAILLGCALIPSYGLMGAAIATACAVAAQNLLAAWQVKKVLGFNTLAFWQKI